MWMSKCQLADAPMVHSSEDAHCCKYTGVRGENGLGASVVEGTHTGSQAEVESVTVLVA